MSRDDYDCWDNYEDWADEGEPVPGPVTELQGETVTNNDSYDIVNHTIATLIERVIESEKALAELRIELIRTKDEHATALRDAPAPTPSRDTHEFVILQQDLQAAKDRARTAEDKVASLEARQIHLPTDEIQKMLHAALTGNKISVIKSIRSLTQLGLKEAKELCDRAYENTPRGEPKV